MAMHGFISVPGYDGFRIWQPHPRRGSPENIVFGLEPLDKEDIHWWDVVTQGVSVLVETVRGQQFPIGWRRARQLGLVA